MVHREHGATPGGNALVLPKERCIENLAGLTHPVANKPIGNSRTLRWNPEFPKLTAHTPLHELNRDAAAYHRGCSLQTRQRDVVLRAEEPVNLRAARLQQRGHFVLRNFFLLHGLGELPRRDFLDRLRLCLFEDARHHAACIAINQLATQPGIGYY